MRELSSESDLHREQGSATEKRDPLPLAGQGPPLHGQPGVFPPSATDSQAEVPRGPGAGGRRTGPSLCSDHLQSPQRCLLVKGVGSCCQRPWGPGCPDRGDRICAGKPEHSHDSEGITGVWSHGLGRGKTEFLPHPAHQPVNQNKGCCGHLWERGLC